MEKGESSRKQQNKESSKEEEMETTMVTGMESLDTDDNTINIDEELKEIDPSKWKSSVVSKLISEKYFNIDIFVRVLVKSWKMKKEVEVGCLGNN